jgi:hypothetical protein
MADSVRTLKAVSTSNLCAIPDVCIMPVGESLSCGDRNGLVRTRALALLRAMRRLTPSTSLIFVPHGAPEPTEWLANHRDFIKLPATFVPRRRSDGLANRLSGGPAGQRGTVDGLATTSELGRPSPPAAVGAMANSTNVGLFVQQTGLTLDETLTVAGGYAGLLSSNARPDQPHGLDPTAARFITEGFHIGQSRVFSQPSAP